MGYLVASCLVSSVKRSVGGAGSWHVPVVTVCIRLTSACLKIEVPWFGAQSWSLLVPAHVLVTCSLWHPDHHRLVFPFIFFIFNIDESGFPF